MKKGKQIKRHALACLAGLVLAGSAGLVNAANENTLAHWRFEEGVNGVIHAADWDDFYLDSSGNTNHLSSWPLPSPNINRPTATNQVPYSVVPQTGEANTLALAFLGKQDLSTGGGNTGFKMLETYMFTNGWTFECTFLVTTNGLHQGLFGKDGKRGTFDGDPSTGPHPPFRMKIRPPSELVECQILDDNDVPITVKCNTPVETHHWYSVAATYDTETLSIYLKGEGDEEYVFQNSVSVPAGVTLGRYDKKWAVGRIRWDGNPADYMYGVLDEVRISNIALNPNFFIAVNGLPPPAINILAEQLSGTNGLALTWDTASWIDYSLLSKSSLGETTWTTNQAGIPGGEAGSVTVTTGVDQAQSFYRVTGE